MNAKQRQYAAGRISSVAQEKENVLRAAKTKELDALKAEVPHRDWATVKELIKTRKIKLKESASAYTDIIYAFELPGEAAVEKKKLAVTKSYDTRIATLKKDAAAIVDELHLGDAAAAMSLVTKFIESEF